VEATAQAKGIASKVLELLNQPYLLDTSHHQSSGSIGIALFDKDDGVVEELLKRADLAQYRAKSAGGGAFRFFDPGMQAKAESRAALERDLRKAISKGQLRLHYQPQVDDASHITGCEGLLRWEHPEKGLLYPMDFIVSAEEHGIIESIGFWVIETACKQLMKWSFKPATSQLTLAVNVSAREFGHPDFVNRTKMILEESGADPSKLTLEFTERVMFGPLAETLSKMSTLGALGLAFALDDFGMGFSSLACLRSLPLSQLKLDRSFVCDVVTNRSDGVIASSVIELGQSLGMSVIAEGVETQEQWQFLSDHGCRLYQGYLFGRPAPLEQLSFGLEQQTIVKRVN
jgi:EAL domain-containing protein (putative c-di-GMP-specific phosphodiesterase class I)